MNNSFQLLNTFDRYKWLLAIAVLALFLNIWNNDFSIRFHGDEAKKFYFVASFKQDFQHPILMLQLGRLANFFAQIEDRQELAILCRSISAFAGVLVVLASFFIARRVVGARYELLAAIAVGVSPILVVHAHYYKEDMVFTAAALFSLLFYMRFYESRRIRDLVGLGIFTGLAFSAQYKAALLLPLYFLFPLSEAVSQRKRLVVSLLGMLVAALIVAVLVNYPALLDPDVLIKGLKFEADHVGKGHTLSIYPLAHFFVFHLTQSLVPGMSAPVVVLGCIGFLTCAARWREVSSATRILLVYTLGTYLIHEITPMKAAPDFMRYMVPVAPALIIFAVKSLEDINTILAARLPVIATRVVSVLCLCVIVAYPLYRSIMLDYNMSERDTRVLAAAWLKENKGSALFEKYASLERTSLKSVIQVDIPRARQYNYNLLVASSFQYGRYVYGATLDDQPKEVYMIEQQYRELFEKYPYYEISPEFESFAYSNPVIRIIDISKGAK